MLFEWTVVAIEQIFFVKLVIKWKQIENHIYLDAFSNDYIGFSQSPRPFNYKCRQQSIDPPKWIEWVPRYNKIYYT